MVKYLYQVLALLAAIQVYGSEPDYDQLFFDNSLMPESWHYSRVEYQAPSFLLNIQGRLPVEDSLHFTPGNCLELKYVSAPEGSWKVQLDHPMWRGKDHIKQGNALVFRMLVPGETPVDALPRIGLMLEDSTSAELTIGKYLPEIEQDQWMEVKIPLKDFAGAAGGKFSYSHSKEIVSVLFMQSNGDNQEHLIYIDQVEFYPAKPAGKGTVVPEIAEVKGYERHVDISWKPVDTRVVKYIQIYRSEGTGEFVPVAVQNPVYASRYADFTGEPGKTYRYRISCLDYDYNESELSSPASAETYEMTDGQLLDMVQEACFRYYWEGAEQVSGLALENIPGRKNMIATGASGFGLMALVVGTERGFITREQLTERLGTIVQFIEGGDRFHGALSHFMDGPTGKVEPFFGKYDNGGDLVETSFFMQGLLAASLYLSDENPEEKALKHRMTALWNDVEWDWYRKSADSPFLYWHWSPEHEWHIDHPLIGWNETLITYFLAIASPTHPVPAEMYYTGWASQSKRAQEYRTNWGNTSDGSMFSNNSTYYGVQLDVGVSNGGPLFFVHYSFLGLDPQKLTDRYTNYFRNNQAIARINYRYCCENPNRFPEYGKDCWGLTASDGPWGYKAREPVKGMDDGTIAPTGALASFPYLPDEAMEALKFYYRDCGHFLWGEYGFRDAFNLQEDWVAPIFMGLNQAPVAVMIENYRSGLLWNLFMSAADVQKGMQKLNEVSNEE